MAFAKSIKMRGVTLGYHRVKFLTLPEFDGATDVLEA